MKIKKQTVFGFIVFCILFTSIHAVAFQHIELGYEKNSYDSKLAQNDYPKNTTSFHIHSLEGKFWSVLKVYLPAYTTVTIDAERHQKFTDGTQLEETLFDCELICDGNTGDINGCKGTASIKPQPNRYVHLNVGPINWSFNNIQNTTDNFSASSTSTSILSDLDGLKYFIFMGYAPLGNYSYWFNTSKEVEILGVNEGNDTFFYHRDDFRGKLNVGTEKILMIIDGVIDLTVDNYLIYSFLPPYKYAGISYDNCKGLGMMSIGHNSCDNLLYKYYFNIGSMPFKELITPGFPCSYIFNLGPSGTYSFKTTCFNYRKDACIPDMQLYGADIILPL